MLKYSTAEAAIRLGCFLRYFYAQNSWLISLNVKPLLLQSYYLQPFLRAEGDLRTNQNQIVQCLKGEMNMSFIKKVDRDIIIRLVLKVISKLYFAIKENNLKQEIKWKHLLEENNDRFKELWINEFL
jgi:hypothetical protein